MLERSIVKLVESALHNDSFIILAGLGIHSLCHIHVDNCEVALQW